MSGTVAPMRWLSLRVARLLGWRMEGALPDEPKMVVLGYPHTSNWDFFLFLAALEHFGLTVRFLGAKGLFVGPFGWFLRRSGGIAVDQSTAQALVATVLAEFEAADEMILVMAPEGTRRSSPHWRSGFWRIADAADVPVVPVALDAPSRRIELGPAARIDGDPHRWMEGARAFYDGIEGLVPGREGPVRLRDEIPGG